MGSLKREAQRRFLKEQRKLEKAARKNVAAVEYAIVYKLNHGRWSMFRKYTSEERRDKVFDRVVLKRQDAQWRRIDL